MDLAVFVSALQSEAAEPLRAHVGAERARLEQAVVDAATSATGRLHCVSRQDVEAEHKAFAGAGTEGETGAPGPADMASACLRLIARAASARSRATEEDTSDKNQHGEGGGGGDRAGEGEEAKKLLRRFAGRQASGPGTPGLHIALSRYPETLDEYEALLQVCPGGALDAVVLVGGGTLGATGDGLARALEGLAEAEDADGTDSKGASAGEAGGSDVDDGASAFCGGPRLREAVDRAAAGSPWRDLVLVPVAVHHAAEDGDGTGQERSFAAYQAARKLHGLPRPKPLPRIASTLFDQLDALGAEKARFRAWSLTVAAHAAGLGPSAAVAALREVFSEPPVEDEGDEGKTEGDGDGDGDGDGEGEGKEGKGGGEDAEVLAAAMLKEAEEEAGRVRAQAVECSTAAERIYHTLMDSVPPDAQDSPALVLCGLLNGVTHAHATQESGEPHPWPAAPGAESPTGDADPSDPVRRAEVAVVPHGDAAGLRAALCRPVDEGVSAARLAAEAADGEGSSFAAAENSDGGDDSDGDSAAGKDAWSVAAVATTQAWVSRHPHWWVDAEVSLWSTLPLPGSGEERRGAPPVPLLDAEQRALREGEMHCFSAMATDRLRRFELLEAAHWMVRDALELADSEHQAALSGPQGGSPGPSAPLWAVPAPVARVRGCLAQLARACGPERAKALHRLSSFASTVQTSETLKAAAEEKEALRRRKRGEGDDSEAGAGLEAKSGGGEGADDPEPGEETVDSPADDAVEDERGEDGGGDEAHGEGEGGEERKGEKDAPHSDAASEGQFPGPPPREKLPRDAEIEADELGFEAEAMFAPPEWTPQQERDQDVLIAAADPVDENFVDGAAGTLAERRADADNPVTQMLGARGGSASAVSSAADGANSKEGHEHDAGEDGLARTAASEARGSGAQLAATRRTRVTFAMDYDQPAAAEGEAAEAGNPPQEGEQKEEDSGAADEEPADDRDDGGLPWDLREREWLEPLPSPQVLRQRLASALLLDPEVRTRYVPSQDALVLALLWHTPRERRKDWLWSAVPSAGAAAGTEATDTAPPPLLSFSSWLQLGSSRPSLPVDAAGGEAGSGEGGAALVGLAARLLRLVPPSVHRRVMEAPEGAAPDQAAAPAGKKSDKGKGKGKGKDKGGEAEETGGEGAATLARAQRARLWRAEREARLAAWDTTWKANQKRRITAVDERKLLAASARRARLFPADRSLIDVCLGAGCPRLPSAGPEADGASELARTRHCVRVFRHGHTYSLTQRQDVAPVPPEAAAADAEAARTSLSGSHRAMGPGGDGGDAGDGANGENVAATGAGGGEDTQGAMAEEKEGREEEEKKIEEGEGRDAGEERKRLDRAWEAKWPAIREATRAKWHKPRTFVSRYRPLAASFRAQFGGGGLLTVGDGPPAPRKPDGYGTVAGWLFSPAERVVVWACSNGDVEQQPAAAGGESAEQGWPTPGREVARRHLGDGSVAVRYSGGTVWTMRPDGSTAVLRPRGEGEGDEGDESPAGPSLLGDSWYEDEARGGQHWVWVETDALGAQRVLCAHSGRILAAHEAPKPWEGSKAAGCDTNTSTLQQWARSGLGAGDLALSAGQVGPTGLRVQRLADPKTGDLVVHREGDPAGGTVVMVFYNSRDTDEAAAAARSEEESEEGGAQAACFFADGTVLLRKPQGSVVARRPGCCIVERFPDADAVSRGHAAGGAVSLARGSRALRCRVADTGGVTLALEYDTRSTSTVAGSLTWSLPEGTQVVASDSGDVEVRPRDIVETRDALQRTDAARETPRSAQEARDETVGVLRFSLAEAALQVRDHERNDFAVGPGGAVGVNLAGAGNGTKVQGPVDDPLPPRVFLLPAGHPSSGLAVEALDEGVVDEFRGALARDPRAVPLDPAPVRAHQLSLATDPPADGAVAAAAAADAAVAHGKGGRSHSRGAGATSRRPGGGSASSEPGAAQAALVAPGVERDPATVYAWVRTYPQRQPNAAAATAVAGPVPPGGCSSSTLSAWFADRGVAVPAPPLQSTWDAAMVALRGSERFPLAVLAAAGMSPDAVGAVGTHRAESLWPVVRAAMAAMGAAKDAETRPPEDKSAPFPLAPGRAALSSLPLALRDPVALGTAVLQAQTAPACALAASAPVRGDQLDYPAHVAGDVVEWRALMRVQPVGFHERRFLSQARARYREWKQERSRSVAHFAVEDDRPQDAVAAEQAFQERVRARHREAQKAQERARLEAEREAKRAESRAAEEEESRPTATASSPQRKALRGAVGSSEAPAASRGADHVDAAAAAGSEAEDDSLSDTSSGAESEGAMHPQRRRAAVRRQLEEQAQTLSSSRAAPPVSDPALRRRSRESARGARSRYAGMATLQALGAEDEEEYWALREEPVREGTGPSREATAAPAPGSAPANGRDGGMRAQSRRAQRHLDARASRKGPDVARERGQGGAAGIGEDPAPGARSRGSHGRSKPRHVRHRDRVAHLATVDRSSDLVRPGGTRGGSRSLRRAQALAKRLGLSLKEALGREEERLILRTVPERVSFGEVPEGWHLVATITLRNHTEEVARYRVARPRVTTAADVDASLTGAEAREPVWAQPNTVTVVQAPGGVAAGMDKAMAVHLRARQVGEVEERVEIVTEHETLVVPVHAVVTASQESPGGAAQQGSPAAGAGIRVVGRVRGWEKHWSARGRSVEERKLSVGTASARGGDEGRGGRSAAESGDGPSVETTPSSEAAPPVVTGEGRQANPSPADAAAPAGPDRRTGTNDAPGGSAASSPGEAAPQGNVSPAPPAAPSRTSAPASGPHLGPTAGMTDAEREAADDEAERHLLQEMARSSRR